VKKENENLIGRIFTLEKEHSELSEDVKILQLNIKTKDEELASTKKGLEEFDNLKTDFKDKTREKDEEIEMSKVKIDTLNAKVKTMEEDMKEVYARITDVERANKTLKTQTKMLQEENRILSSSVEKRKEQFQNEFYSDISKELKALREENSKNSVELERVTEELKDSQNENSSSNEKIKQLLEENEALRRKAKEYERVVEFFKKSSGGVLIE
jgi:hypothetical protein